MVRGLVDALLLFALPFAAYTAGLVLQRRYPFLRAQWSQGRLAVLAVAGLALAAAGLIFFGLLVPRHRGAYQPAHIEGGRLVPGHID